MKLVPRIKMCTKKAFYRRIASRPEPLVIQDASAHLPLLSSGIRGGSAILDALGRLVGHRQVRVFESVDGMLRIDPRRVKPYAWKLSKRPLSELIVALKECGLDESSRRHLYVPSIGTDRLPEISQLKLFPLVEMRWLPKTEPRIWLSNGEHHMQLHYDGNPNFACLLAGSKRVTLFPPDELANLYIGPLDESPIGTPCSLIDMTRPDPKRFPRFRRALKSAWITDLEAGDVLFIPAYWWHSVSSKGLNILLSYWWLDLDPTIQKNALGSFFYSLYSIRKLPLYHQRIYKAFFDYFVFRSHGDPYPHLPDGKQGIAGKRSPDREKTLERRVRDIVLSTIKEPVARTS